MGLFWKNGEEAMHDRALFGQFFKIENLNKLMPQIIQTVTSRMKETSESKFDSKSRDWKMLDVHQLFRDIFSDVVESILFGEKATLSGEEVPLPDLIAVYVNRSATSAFSIGNLLSWELMQKFGLGKYCKETDAIYDQIQERCWWIYQQRLKSGPKKHVNMLDLLIEQNSTMQKKLTKYDIVGVFVMFQFAGADTSRTISQSFTYFLSDKPELQKKILEDVD